MSAEQKPEQPHASDAATTPFDVPKRIPFDTILNLLRSRKDEERFVGLLLLTKTGSSDDINLLRLAREAVGMEFIDRLARTEGYRGLALSMLATFSADPAFVSLLVPRVQQPFVSSDDAANAPQLHISLSVLCSPGADPAEVADAYRCVMAVVAAQAPAVASAGLLVPLAKAATVLTGDAQLNLVNAVAVVSASSSNFHSIGNGASLPIDAALRTLFPTLVSLLARRDSGAFTAIQTMANLLDSLAPDEWSSIADALPLPVRTETNTALTTLLSSKMGASQRALILVVVAYCLRAWGLKWATPKLGSLSTQLARAELEVALHYHSNAAPVAERARVVSSCALLLDTVIDRLASYADDANATGLTPELLLAYKAPLDEAAATVLSYFETSPTDPVELQVTALRPLASWLSELDELPAGLEAALPALLSLPDDALPHLLPTLTIAASQSTFSVHLLTHNVPARLVAFFTPQLPVLVSAAKHSPPAMRALAGACACMAALANAGAARTFAPLQAALGNAAEQLCGTDAGDEAAVAVAAIRRANP